MRPSSDISLDITFNKPSYQPGDLVNMSLSLSDSAPSNETFFASLTVTDISSYLSIPPDKLMPSLPSMIYLEKEIKNLNGELDEFPWSAEFLDAYNDADLNESAKVVD